MPISRGSRLTTQRGLSVLVAVPRIGEWVRAEVWVGKKPATNKKWASRTQINNNQGRLLRWGRKRVEVSGSAGMRLAIRWVYKYDPGRKGEVFHDV